MSQGPRVSIVRSGVDFQKLIRIWEREAEPVRLDSGVHRANVKILRPVASALRKAAKGLRKSFDDPRSGAAQRSKSRNKRVAGNIRIFKSKREKMVTRLVVKRTAYWGLFVESGTATRSTKSGKNTGKIQATNYATNLYRQQNPAMKRRIRKEYVKIFADLMKKAAIRSRKRKKLL